MKAKPHKPKFADVVAGELDKAGVDYQRDVKFKAGDDLPKVSKTAKKLYDKAKQAYLPDMEPPRINAIDAAAGIWIEARSALKDAKEFSDESGEDLLSLMHDNNLTRYEFDGNVFTISELEKISVKPIKEESPE